MVISPKLRTASSVMAWLSLAAAMACAITASIGILSPLEFHHGGLNLVMHFSLPNGSAITQATPLIYRAAVFLAASIPIGLSVWMLLTLSRTFRHFATGRVFDTATLSCINRVASLLVWMVLAEIPTQPIILFIMGRAVGQSWYGYLIAGDEFPKLFSAGVVLVIARVMAEAQRIADENAKFV